MSESAGATFDLLQWMDEAMRLAFRAAIRPRRYAAGQTIYVQGEPGREMYRVAAGSVRLSVTGIDGRELIFRLFEPGDCFGESSLVDGGPRPQTAQALTGVVLEVLDATAYRRLRAEHRAFDDALMALLARQMRFVSDRYAAVNLSDLPVRLAARILETARAASDADRGALEMSLPQTELAMMVGASRQTVNRALGRLEANGLIATEYGKIRILDLPGLARLASGA